MNRLRYRLSQQRCGELEGKLQQLQQQHRVSLQTNPANMIEATRASAIADLEHVRSVVFSSSSMFMHSLPSFAAWLCFAVFVVSALCANSNLDQSRSSLSERCMQLEALLAQVRNSTVCQPHFSIGSMITQVENPTPPHVVAQMRARESELLQVTLPLFLLLPLIIVPTSDIAPPCTLINAVAARKRVAWRSSRRRRQG